MMDNGCKSTPSPPSSSPQRYRRSSTTRRKPARARCLAPFLSKTYELLIDGSGAPPHIVSWNGEGTGFVVWLPQEFAECVLPRYFKHCNFSSFIRQLNTYGFKKSAPDRWEFQHEKFRNGKRHMLAEITRRKCKPSAFPSFLKAREKESDLQEENKELKKKNAELQLQIAQYKELEKELRKWLSQYM